MTLLILGGAWVLCLACFIIVVRLYVLSGKDQTPGQDDIVP